MPPEDMEDPPPYGAAPVLALAAKRPWWHPRKRDLLGVVAMVCVVVAWSVGHADGPDQAVFVGELPGVALWVCWAVGALILGGMWIIARAWLGARPHVLLLAVRVLVTAGVLVVWSSAALLGLVSLAWSSNFEHEKFTPPGSQDEYRVWRHAESPWIQSVWRGGPWTYTRVGSIDDKGDGLGIDYSAHPPELVYSTRHGLARVPIEGR